MTLPEPRNAPPAAPAPEQRDGPARAYRVREVSVVLAVFAMAMLLLDSEGLATWARRMENGAAQSMLLAATSRVEHALSAVGLTAPRRALVASFEAIGRALGSEGDTVLSEGWKTEGSGVVPPATPHRPSPAPRAQGVQPPTSEGPATVLLVGDSMFGNLASAISVLLADDPRVRVVSAYQPATGLSRPDVYDWGKVVPALLEREKPRLVVCSFGGNDAQPIRVGEELMPFGDAAWEAIYKLRVSTMMQLLASGGARVLWLGLPPMRDEGYARKARQLNQVVAQAASEVWGTEYFELSPLFAGPDGEFTAFVDDGKGMARVRMEDGIHYSPAGARAVARRIATWVRSRLEVPAAGEASAP